VALAVLFRDSAVAVVDKPAGLPVEAAPVHVFLYRSAEEKRRLIGAAEAAGSAWLPGGAFYVGGRDPSDSLRL